MFEANDRILVRCLSCNRIFELVYDYNKEAMTANINGVDFSETSSGSARSRIKKSDAAADREVRQKLQISEGKEMHEKDETETDSRQLSILHHQGARRMTKLTSEQTSDGTVAGDCPATEKETKLYCRCICGNNPYCDTMVCVPVADREPDTLSEALWIHKRWVTDDDTGKHYCPVCAHDVYDVYDDEEEWA
jgi:hypothetical protein